MKKITKYINIVFILLFILILLVCIFYKRVFYENFDENDKNNANEKGIYTAIIIEPRQHKALEFVLTNFTSMLDERWNFIIFHGNKNKTFVENIINNKLQKDSNRIKLINLNVDNLTIHDYNTLFYDKAFYNNIPTEVFLVFQTDTMICSKYKDSIYKYVEYDYVGAPWSWDNENGNGGLSIRRKSKMIELLDTYGDDKYSNRDKTELHNEDLFFSGKINSSVPINKASFDDAKDFSIEGVYSDKSFGIHQAWKWINAEGVKNMNEFCPGLDELSTLQ